jgi:protein-tyrosine-phosphatase
MMQLSVTEEVKLLADGLALVYHEARHVRHLVKPGHLSSTGWERLSSLPRNRVEAWQAIQAVREAAAKAQAAGEATGCFEHQFARNLADLDGLYANDHWKDAKTVGGHAWRRVTAAVAALRDAIECGDVSEITSAAHSLVRARHNNGAVRDKIVELDAAVGVQTGSWWHQRKRVLFVCSGNTCRSPMAEAIARRILATTFDVQSASIEASDGASATRDAIDVMAERGLDIRGHSARGIDSVDVSAFDLVVAMDPGIAYSLRSRGTDPATIIELVIPDPYGKGIECYRATEAPPHTVNE